MSNVVIKLVTFHHHHCIVCEHLNGQCPPQRDINYSFFHSLHIVSIVVTQLRVIRQNMTAFWRGTKDSGSVSVVVEKKEHRPF